MDELNLEALERIPIPEGLEERLSKKIDEWEEAEKAAQKPKRQPVRFRALRYVAAAACIALVFGVSFHLLSKNSAVNLAEQDTYDNPLMAQQEAERALNLLAMNLNKGMGHLEKAKALSDKAENTINEQLNLFQ